MSKDLSKAVELLNAGDVVAIPTETVYGLAGKINSETAIRKIFSIKKRPFFDPLIVHVSRIDQAKKLVEKWPSAAQVLAEKYWPGPLTLVLPKNKSVNDLITSGFQTVGIRMPNHMLALEIIDACGEPLAAPSANIFGRTSPTRAEHVRREFPNQQVYVVDGGACQVGIESTVLAIVQDDNIGAMTKLEILRAGAIRQSDIEKTLSASSVQFQFTFGANRKQSPGQMKHHYMPTTPFVLLKHFDAFDESVLKQVTEKMLQLPKEIDGVEIRQPKALKNGVQLNLSSDPTIAAREFYHQLRVSDDKQADLIYFVVSASMKGEEWAALLERMHKAATLVI